MIGVIGGRQISSRLNLKLARALVFASCLFCAGIGLSAGYVGDVANFYGDSVTVGYNPTPPQPEPNLTNRFSALVCTNLLMIENNYGVGGSEIADAQADAITANNSITDTNVSVWLTGYNDIFWFGTNQAALTDNFAAVESLAAWLAVPTSLRVSSTNTSFGVTDSGIYYGPGWSHIPNTLGGLAFSSQANSASWFFSGSTLLIGTVRIDSGAGNVVVTVGDYVDGNVLPAYITNYYSCVRTSLQTGPGPGASWGNRHYSPALISITGLTTNRHYAFFSPESTANTWLGWYAAYSTNLLPRVELAGVLQIAGSNYSDPYLPNGYSQGSVLAASQYSGMLSNAAATLFNLGLNVTWVPAPVLDAGTNYFYDGIHPNDSGHLKLANAIQNGLLVTTRTNPTAPAIVIQPADVYATAFGPASFSVTATSFGLTGYQWQFNATNLLNATNSTLSIASTTQTNLGQYTVILTNTYGSTTSSVANLYMYPYIYQPFAGLDTFQGRTNTLSIGTWGSGTLSYQWYFNGTNLPNATNSTLILDDVQYTNAGLYGVIVSNSLGSVTNVPTQVEVDFAGVSIAINPSVVIQGAVGHQYKIQSTTNLGDVNSWVTETNIILAQPVQNWTDYNVDTTKPNHPQKFYQVVPGP